MWSKFEVNKTYASCFIAISFIDKYSKLKISKESWARDKKSIFEYSCHPLLINISTLLHFGRGYTAVGLK